MINILVADDHQMFIDGIKALLASNKQCHIKAEAHNGQEVLDVLTKEKIDVVLLDMNMPVMDGLQALKHIKVKHKAVKVIMLTMFNTPDYIEKLLKAGADGYILKNTGKEELNQGIEAVMSGRTFYSKEVTEKIMEGLHRKKQHSNSTVEVELTDREKEVLQWIVKELNTTEIADKLCLSVNTVETHRKNLISKLNVKNIAGLVKYAIQNGFAED